MTKEKTEKAMKEIRERGRKSSVISTFGASDLLDRPGNVDKLYSWYNTTYLPLEDVSNFFENLKKWTIERKRCAKGAIIGGYGYGKTGTGIHLWKRLENDGIIATPPFSWSNFQDIIDGIYGWVKYKLQMEQLLIEKLDKIYQNYREKTLKSVARKMEVSVENIKKLDRGEINTLLKWSPSEVIEFISNVEDIILKSKFKGLVVFTDELQSTVERFPSVSKFLDDFFDIINRLKGKKGKFSMIFEMPTATELMIADARGDIIDRLKEQNLYLKCEEMFYREFPYQLWVYYGDELYVFDHSAIASKDSLDALYQITFREDLGTGPRSVIEALGAIANHWLEKKSQFSPINLIESYLTKEVSFAKGERLVRSVKEQLDSSIIKGNKQREDVIKLLAAFPEYGCPSTTLEKYNLKNILEELLIKEKVYGDVIQELTEGYTLTALLKPEAPLEKTYERIIREFARRYSEDVESIELAFKSFVNHCLQEIFKVHTKGPQPTFGAWKKEDVIEKKDFIEIDLLGSFHEKYPYRKIKLIVSSKKMDTTFAVDVPTFIIHLNSNMERSERSKVEMPEDNKVIFCLNLKRRLEDVEIPGLEIMPKDKVTPLLQLSLLTQIDNRADQIPKTEYGVVREILDRLLKSSINGFFGVHNIDDHTGLSLKSFGTEIFKKIFEKLMNKRYPDYDTLIGRMNWEDTFAPYRAALRDARLSISIKRGKEKFENTKDEVCDLFNISSKLSLKTKLDNMSPLIEYQWSGRDEDNVAVYFKMHPLEEKIIELVKKSTNTIREDGNNIRFINKSTVLSESTKLGYLLEEVEFVFKLLEEREFVKSDDSKLLEVIYSIEDYKKLLEEKDKEIREILEFGKTIPDIDFSQTNNEMAKISDISTIKSIEEYEELDKKYMQIKDQIDIVLEGKIKAIKQVLINFSLKFNTFITERIPPILASPQSGTVSWVADLNECGTLLKRKYTDLLNGGKKIFTNIEGLQKQIEKPDITNFTVIYKKFSDIESKATPSLRSIVGIKQEVQDYNKWVKVLENAGGADKNAREVEKTYNYNEFVEQLSFLFSRIQRALNGRKIDALRDWEIYLKKIEEIEKKIKKWQSIKRNEFTKKKSTYEDSLIKLKVEKYSLRTNFDLFNPQGSFESLYDEVKDVLEVRLQTLKRRTNEYLNILKYFSLIGVEKLDKLLKSAENIKDSLKEVIISVETIKDEEKWSEISSKCCDLMENIKKLEVDMRGLLKQIPPSTDEKAIYTQIIEKGEVDITEIIMDSITKEGKDFNLENFMNKILSLYQKQQIIIKVAPRR